MEERANGRRAVVGKIPLGAATLRTAPTGVRLVLVGETDASMSRDLARLVRDAVDSDLPVEVDTRGVTFMDSSVVAELARLAHMLNIRPLFVQPPELVRFLLSVTRVDDLVDILDHDPGFPPVAVP